MHSLRGKPICHVHGIVFINYICNMEPHIYDFSTEYYVLGQKMGAIMGPSYLVGA